MGRRILVTGADTFWGGRMAKTLESDSNVDFVIGVGTKDPNVEFERTEFVHVDQSYSILSRIVRATKVDTVVHTFMATDSSHLSSRTLVEINVIGTMNLLAAAGGPASSVRQIIVKSSTLVYGATAKDPSFFTESTKRSSTASSSLERSIIEAESYVRDFAEDNPHVVVSLLRFANVLGSDIVTSFSSNFRRRLCPYIVGFDPQLQFVEEDDVVRSLEFVTRNNIPGVFNVAGDGRIPLSEISKMIGARKVPISLIMPDLFTLPLTKLNLLELPAELIELLKYGRGVDNLRLKEAGFTYRYDTASAIENFAKSQRLKRSLGSGTTGYKYQQDLESFFRHSPAIVED